uniref:RRM domain-containing protein n=2 Tax=Mesocestoides corti TaxID=53468 RepID=A0A5K3FP81_MESCO
MTEYKASDLVEMARSRMDELNSRTLLLGHLPRNTTLKKLITVFKDSINARFPRKKFKGNRKYAFLEFASSEAASEALKKAANLSFDGKTPMFVLLSQKTGVTFPHPNTYQLSDFKRCNLIVSCLPRQTVLEDLQSLFPNAKDIFLPHAGPEKTLGSARIDFVDEDDAIAAFTSKHGSMVHNSPIIVNFCVRRKSGKRKRAEHEQKLSSDDTQVQKIEIPANSTAESVQVGVISKQIRKARKRRLSANSGAKVSTPSKSPKTPTRGTGVKRRRSCLNKSTKPQSIKLK